MKTHLTIKQINSTEHWLIATGTILGRKVIGYGTTHVNAIVDAYRDYQVIAKIK